MRVCKEEVVMTDSSPTIPDIQASSSQCNTEEEKPWIKNLQSLFCSWSFIPKGSVSSGTRFNAMTRLVIYTTIILILCKVKLWWVFFAGCAVILLVAYIQHVKPATSTASPSLPSKASDTASSATSRENFAFLSSDNINMSVPLVYNNASNGMRMLFPQTQIPLEWQAEQIRSPDADNQLRLLPTMTNNVTNSGLYVTEKPLNTSKEPGHRDPQAGIQYFTPYVGVNRKTFIEPIIAPRITDQDYWGKRSTVRSDINKLQIVDVTNEAINTNDMAQIPDRFPWAQGDKVSYPLALPVEYQNRVPNGVWNMNPVGQDPDIGFYNSSQDLYFSQDNRDFNTNFLPMYQNPKSYVFPKLDMEPVLKVNATPLYKPYDLPNTSALPPTQFYGVTDAQNDIQQDGVCTSCNGNSTATNKEGFSFLNVDGGRAYPAQLNNYMQQAPQYPLTTQYSFNTDGGKQMLGGNYTEMGRVPPGKDAQIPPVTNQLMYASPTYSYNSNYFDTPNEKLFLQTVQPSLFSYSVDQTPINSSVGIAYAPQRPPRVLDQVNNNGMDYPLYSRVDPQLIRTDGTPGQQASQPTRTNWSAEYSNFQAPPGSINFEDIYDPRFTSYGDPYRSYSDVNLGQIQYYYSDIDAYRMPNFISRSNVDFVDFRTPNGEIWPYYVRDIGIDQVRAHVENQTTADELFHREDLMSLQMDKINRERWQTRFAPIDNNHSFRGGATLHQGAAPMS